jgi:hypothetical protein
MSLHIGISTRRPNHGNLQLRQKGEMKMANQTDQHPFDDDDDDLPKTVTDILTNIANKADNPNAQERLYNLWHTLADAWDLVDAGFVDVINAIYANDDAEAHRSIRPSPWYDRSNACGSRRVSCRVSRSDAAA